MKWLRLSGTLHGSECRAEFRREDRLRTPNRLAIVKKPTMHNSNNHHATIDSAPPPNADAEELANFAAMAAHWWEPQGPLKPLHVLNPTRLDYVLTEASQHGINVSGCRWLDVGCGGGILAEAAARAGAEVTGIDANRPLIDTAKLHAAASGVRVHYETTQVADYAAGHPAEFDIVSCMELLEHVPDPGALLADCLRTLKPGGILIVSTINRTLPAYAGAVVAAEYVLRLLPRGTHDWARFIRPSELARMARTAGAKVTAASGLRYLPVLDSAELCASLKVNYIATLTHAVGQVTSQGGHNAAGQAAGQANGPANGQTDGQANG